MKNEAKELERLDIIRTKLRVLNEDLELFKEKVKNLRTYVDTAREVKFILLDGLGNHKYLS